MNLNTKTSNKVAKQFGFGTQRQAISHMISNSGLPVFKCYPTKGVPESSDSEEDDPIQQNLKEQADIDI